MALSKNEMICSLSFWVGEEGGVHLHSPQAHFFVRLPQLLQCSNSKQGPPYFSGMGEPDGWFRPATAIEQDELAALFLSSSPHSATPLPP